MTPAFLLTRQWADDKDGVRLDLWLTTSQGPLAVSIHQQRALFFIRQADEMAAKKLLANIRGVSVKQLALKTFSQQAVSAVYFDSQQQLYRARDRLAQNDIACFESDIRPTERFLCERFITASIDVDAGYSSEVLHNIRLQPGDYRPDFEIMSLDIESDYETDTLFSIAFVAAEVNRVLMIGEGLDNDFIEYVADERSHFAAVRNFIESGWCIDLQIPALGHHCNPVRHRQRFFLVMGDKNERDADRAL